MALTCWKESSNSDLRLTVILTCCGIANCYNKEKNFKNGHNLGKQILILYFLGETEVKER